jgi:hypothetical protein
MARNKSVLFFFLMPKKPNFEKSGHLTQKMKFPKPSFRFYLFLCLCLFPEFISSVMAQKVNKFMFGVRSGPAIPLGQLASQEGSSGGYGSMGLSGSAEGIWYFRSQFGVGFSVALTSITFEEFAYAVHVVSTDPAMSGLYLKSDNYKVRTFAAGFYYKKSLSGKFSLTGKLNGGLFWAETPDQLYSAKFDLVGNYLTYKITPSHDEEMMFQPGLSCQYHLFDQVSLSFDSEYTIAVPGFKFHTSSTSYVKNLTFSYINAMLGIDFRF